MPSARMLRIEVLLVPIHDLGYRKWDGTPSPHVMRWAVIAHTGIKLAWRSHWLRRMALLAWIPVVGMGMALFFHETVFTEPEQRAGMLRLLRRSPLGRDLDISPLASAAESRHAIWSWAMLTLFRNPQLVAMLFVVGLIAPTLISRDMQSRAFLLYFSRPIERADYLIGKSAVVWFYLGIITTLPALALYALAVSLSPDLSVIAYTWDLPLRILGASLWLILPTTAVALCFSSMTTESRYAAFAWVAVWVLGWVAYGVLSPRGAGSLTGAPIGQLESQWSLLSLYHTLGRVQSWIFGVETDFSSVMPSILMLIIVTGGATTLLIQRISSPLRV